mgnify:CR=1 FL=1
MGSVVDMTGRELNAGEVVTATAGEQLEQASARQIWDDAPLFVRDWADGYGLEYPEAVELLVHSLLTEARQAAVKYDRAGEVLEFIRSRFVEGEDEE